jgi:hypothetical protein
LFTTTLGAFAVGTDLSVTTVLETVFVSADKTGFAITDINIITNNINKFFVINFCNKSIVLEEIVWLSPFNK